MTSIDTIISRIIDREGGYVDHPNDRGGPTKYGITIRTLSQWRKKECSSADVKAMTYAEAEDIYHTVYVDNSGLAKIESMELRALMVDSAVQHGTTRAVRWLQSACNVKQDGRIGPATLEAVRGSLPEALCLSILAQRGRFYTTLASRPSQRVFALGWFKRYVEAVEDVA